MAASSYKHYNVDEFDPQHLLGMYCSSSSDREIIKELIIFPMKKLKALFSSGAIKAETMMDFSAGAIIFQLLACCDYVRSITVLDTNGSCIQELEKWKKKEENAFNWSQLLDVFKELEGDSDKWMKIEETLRSKIKKTAVWDLNKNNPTDPIVLPKADCVVSLYIMGTISPNKEAYRENLKKLASFLRPGGHLLIFGGLNAEFFTIAGHKYHNLNLDEGFVRKAIEDAGFIIQCFEVLLITAMSGLLVHKKLGRSSVVSPKLSKVPSWSKVYPSTLKHIPYGTTKAFAMAA